jgi:hypothetical protein
MILPAQNLIRSRDLANELGVCINTICDWSRKDLRFKAAKFKRGWFSVQKLRDAGVLSTPVHSST